jgi:hypothetical protein
LMITAMLIEWVVLAATGAPRAQKREA